LANSGEVVKPEVEILPLRGSIEVAGELKLADCIVDLVVTGKTLAAHNLVEIQHIKSYSAVVLVNKAAIKLKGKRDLLLKILEEYIAKNSV
jgi:ATP phosphoribosyltransferase